MSALFLIHHCHPLISVIAKVPDSLFGFFAWYFFDVFDKIVMREGSAI